MRIPSGPASRPHRLTCQLCERGVLDPLGTGFARCGLCGLSLLGSSLETLWDIIGLPDVPGAHPCECGHPEMRRLPAAEPKWTANLILKLLEASRPVGSERRERRVRETAWPADTGLVPDGGPEGIQEPSPPRQRSAGIQARLRRGVVREGR